MNYSPPNLGRAAVLRWQADFNAALVRAGFTSQIGLAVDLARRLQIVDSTAESYLARLRNGGNGAARRLLSNDERCAVLAGLLKLSVPELREMYDQAADPLLDDPWQLLFGDGAPETIPARLKHKQEVNDAASWVEELSGLEAPPYIEITGAPGAGVDVARQQVATVLSALGKDALHCLPPGGDPGARQVVQLQVEPWDSTMLRRLAELIGAPQRIVAQLFELAKLADRAPAALAPLLRPRRVLGWLRELRQAPAGSQLPLHRFWIEATWRRAMERARGLEAVDMTILCSFSKRWCLESRAHGPEGWVLPEGRAMELLGEALEARGGRPWSASRLDELIEATGEAKRSRDRKAAVEDLRAYIASSPRAVAGYLQAAGLVQGGEEGWRPADVELLTALAARELVRGEFPPELLDPTRVELLEWLGIEGVTVAQLTDALDTSSAGRRHRAYQAAAICLTVRPAPETLDEVRRAVRIWAGSLVSMVRAIGNAIRPGHIPGGPSPFLEKLATRMQQLSERGREWLPELDSTDLLASLQGHAPGEILHAADRWDHGKPPLSTLELDRLVLHLAPWQCDPLALEGGLMETSAHDELFGRIVLWQAKRGRTRSRKVLAGLETLPDAFPFAARELLWELPRSHRGRMLLALPDETPDLHEARVAFIKSGWPFLERVDDEEEQAVIGVALSLPPTAIRPWLRAGLLSAAMGDRGAALLPEDEKHLIYSFRGRDDYVERLWQLVENLDDHELLVELTELPQRAVGDPVLVDSLVPRPRPGSQLALSFNSPSGGQVENMLRHLTALDSIAERAALILNSVGDAEALRHRWRVSFTFPDGLIRQLWFRWLLHVVGEAGTATWERYPPPEEIRDLERELRRGALQEREEEFQVRFFVGPRVLKRHQIPDAALPTLSALDAIHNILDEALGEALPEELLGWLASMAWDSSQPVSIKPPRRIDGDAALAHLGWYRPLKPPREIAACQLRAERALAETEDGELILEALQMLVQDRWMPGKALEICRAAWRTRPAFAGRCWILASDEEARKRLTHDVLMEGSLPEAALVPWAHRAWKLGVDVQRVLPKVRGSAARAIGLPWVEEAREPDTKLQRALLLHASSPWPEPLWPALQHWALEEPDPFGVSDKPRAWIRESVAAQALGLLDQVEDKERATVRRQGLERLWRLALELPAQRNTAKDGYRYRLTWTIHRPIHELARMLAEHGLSDLLLETWRHPPEPRRGDEVWGEEHRHSRPTGVRALLGPFVMLLLSTEELHGLRDGPHGAAAARKLIELCDLRLIDEVQRSLASNAEFSTSWTDGPVLAPDLQLTWYEALDLLCLARPGQLQELFTGWLRRFPDQRVRLLRALAGWADPDQPVVGARELLEAELDVLFVAPEASSSD